MPRRRLDGAVNDAEHPERQGNECQRNKESTHETSLLPSRSAGPDYSDDSMRLNFGGSSPVGDSTVSAESSSPVRRATAASN